jgi:hypothetical protein
MRGRIASAVAVSCSGGVFKQRVPDSEDDLARKRKHPALDVRDPRVGLELESAVDRQDGLHRALTEQLLGLRLHEPGKVAEPQRPVDADDGSRTVHRGVNGGDARTQGVTDDRGLPKRHLLDDRVHVADEGEHRVLSGAGGSPVTS